jgi:hypothetical protein
MSNARNLADVISGNYDVPAGSLDNVDLSSRVAKSGDTMTGNLIVDANVGIGTSSPAGKIDVQTGTNEYSVFRSTVAGADILLKDSGTTLGNVRLRGINNAMAFIAGGDERLRIDNAGRVTKPYQPMFTANTPTTATLLSGSYWKFGGWNVIKNIGGHYNGTTGVFTAPVSGVYLFRTVIMGYDFSNSSSPHVGFSLNGSDNSGGQVYGANDLWEHPTNANHKTDSMHLFYLNANDFVAIRALSENIGQSSRTYFMGCLLG